MEVIEMKVAFERANRLLKKIGFPLLEVGNRREADKFLSRYISMRFITPICSVRFEGRPIAAYAFDDHYNCKVYIIPLTRLFMRPDSKEVGFALAWKALYENFVWDKKVFSVEVNLHSSPNSPTRCYVLKVTPCPTIGKFELITFYDLENDSFRITLNVFNPQGLLVGEYEAHNDFSAIGDYLLRPLALLSL
jgi:hypothetical protein